MSTRTETIHCYERYSRRDQKGAAEGGGEDWAHDSTFTAGIMTFTFLVQIHFILHDRFKAGIIQH
jgi:hypothetical protein